MPFFKSLFKSEPSESCPKGHEIKRLLDQGNVVFAGFFNNPRTDFEIKYMKVAYRNLNKHYASFVYSYDPKVIRPFYSGSDDVVMAIRPKYLTSKSEPQSEMYKGIQSENAIEKFVYQVLYGVVGIRTNKTLSIFRYPLCIVYYPLTSSNHKKHRTIVALLSKEHRDEGGDLNFAVSDPCFFKVDLDPSATSTLPAVVIIERNGLKYVMERVFNKANLKKFLTAYKTENLRSYELAASAPCPSAVCGKADDADEEMGHAAEAGGHSCGKFPSHSNAFVDSPVKEVQSPTFNQMVMFNCKDVLIEFFVPECPYCKDLAPVYRELGIALVREEVDVLTMNLSINDCPPFFNLRKLPSVFWLGTNKDIMPVEYKGDYSYQDLLKFVAKNASKPLRNYDRQGRLRTNMVDYGTYQRWQ